MEETEETSFIRPRIISHHSYHPPQEFFPHEFSFTPERVCARLLAVDKKVKKHLQKRGVTFQKGRRKDGLFGTDRSVQAFFTWFFEGVMRFDSMAYRRQFWREASLYGHTIGDFPYTQWEFIDPKRYPREWFSHLIILMGLMGVSAVVWCLVKELDRHISRLRRPTYYERERARRRRLADARRKITRRHTYSPCPTPDELAAAFSIARQSTENMIRFGSLLEDLECYVDNSLIWNTETGKIAGRQGGIRQWLRIHAPDLSLRYKTVMRYKALAKKFRQAMNLSDPIPAAWVLDDVSPARLSARYEKQRADVLARKTNEVHAFLNACEGTVISFSAQLALHLGEEFIAKKKKSRGRLFRRRPSSATIT